MYVVRIQRAVTQTLKAGLVLYLHSKKKNNNKCLQNTLSLFSLISLVLHIYKTDSMPSFVKTNTPVNELLHETDQ